MNNKNIDRHRFNILDIIIILAVISALTFAINIIMNDLLTNNMENIEYIVKITDVEADRLNAISLGDKVISRTNNAMVGKVINVESSPKVTYVFNYETDRFVAVEHRDKYDIYITLSAVCSSKNNLFFVNNNIISANRNIEIAVPFFYSDAFITKVYEVVDKEVLTDEK